MNNYYEKLKAYKRCALILINAGKVHFDIHDAYNPKTKWFIYGCEQEGTTGVGREEASRLFRELLNDRSGATRLKFSDPMFNNEVPALVYERCDGKYMKILFKEKDSKGKYCRVAIVLHSMKENDYWELYKNDYR